MSELSRDKALEILKKHISGEALIRHSLTVEAVMRHFAGIFSENPDEWGVIGLLHDIDYEKYPEEHCQHMRGMLSEENVPEHIIRAAESHGYSIVNDVEPQTNAEKVLFTIDELTGLISATAIMRPSRSLSDLTYSSVKKKWKSKAFAANVDRDLIASGAEKLGFDLEYLITETIEGMRPVPLE